MPINVLWSTAGAPPWQRNYYERIVRNERQLQRLWRYIEHNPAPWRVDDENPVSMGMKAGKGA